MTFSKYELFSQKKNLIVAHFSLHNNIKKNIIKFKNSFVEYGAPYEDFYEPHITIGKIMNCNSNTKVDLSCIKNLDNNIIYNLKLKLNSN
jgi:hypothetical protein